MGMEGAEEEEERRQDEGKERWSGVRAKIVG